MANPYRAGFSYYQPPTQPGLKPAPMPQPSQFDTLVKQRPVYNPYLQADGSLKSQAVYRPHTVGYQDNSSLYAKQRSDLGASVDADTLAQKNYMAMRGGIDSGASERLSQAGLQAKSRAMSNLYASQSQQDVDNRYRTDTTNAGILNQGEQFNLGNMYGENRYNNASQLDAYKAMMDAYGSKESSEAMMANANKKGGFLSTVLGALG